MAEVIKTTFQLRRGNAAVWARNNPVLERGEPGFVIDENRLKIGDGTTPWNDLAYIGEGSIFNGKTVTDFPATGLANVIYKAEQEGALYQWNTETLQYELLSLGVSEELETLKQNIIDIQTTVNEISKHYLSKEEAQQIVETKKFEIFSKPQGALVKYGEKEIRIMCPKDTDWKLQEVGNTGNANMYYLGFKAYAPKEAVSFKEGDQGKIKDEIFTFDNDFAGVDEFGRKYSVVWLAAAQYDSADNSWIYFGANSTTQHYVGWTYVVEWYDANDVKIASDSIRINLSNEECHDEIEPYYMGAINVNKLVQSPDDVLILYGGSATDNI